MNTQHKSRLFLGLLLITMLVAVVLSGCTPTVIEPEVPPIDEPDITPDPPPEPDPYLLLVNADNPLPEDMVPNLKTVQGQFKLEAKAADALLEMMAAAKAEGISLLVVSAHRPYATQERLFKNQVQKERNRGYSEAGAVIEAATKVARPGTSEHNTGLAADVMTPSYQTMNAAFAKTKEAKWMAANAHHYGFVLRYGEDKQDITKIIFEPWHFRYVGPEHAARMFTENLCLEEYLIKYGN